MTSVFIKNMVIKYVVEFLLHKSWMWHIHRKITQFSAIITKVQEIPR